MPGWPVPDCPAAAGPRVTFGKSRQPFGAIALDESSGVGGGDDVALDPAVGVDDERQLGFKCEVRPDVDLGDDRVVEVETRGIGAGIAGEQADAVGIRPILSTGETDAAGRPGQ